MNRLIVAALFLSVTAPGSMAEKPTYENFGEIFITQYCTSCHHSTRTPDERHGAPEGIDFDNLELVYEFIDQIYDMATGPNPEMPPANGVWPWDRELLEEWLLSGAPGEGVEHLPVLDLPSPKAESLWYERLKMEVNRPNGMAANQRKVHLFGLQHFTGKQNVLEETFEIERQPDGSVVMLSRRNRRDNNPTSPFIKYEYDPPVPLVLSNMTSGEKWETSVQATPRFDNGSAGPVAQIDFMVMAEGVEVLDNGVGAPTEAFRVRVHSYNHGNPRNPESEEFWWFQIGVGPMRYERSVSPVLYQGIPDAEAGFDKAYLAAGPEIRNDTQSYFPFENGMKVWNFEHQRKIYLATGGGEPTQTPTLGEDYTRTPTPIPSETPTFTLSATPTKSGTPTQTGTNTRTPTETQTSVVPPSTTPTSSETSTATPSHTLISTPSVTPTEQPSVTTTLTPVSNPLAGDMDANGKVDGRDLIVLMAVWNGGAHPSLNQPLPEGGMSASNLFGFSRDWQQSSTD